MAKDPIEKEKEDNPNTPGAGLSKSQEAIQKTKELTDKITEVSGKVQLGMTYALFAVDGISTIRSLVGDADEAAYDTRQELKQQAKGEAIQRVKEELPTKQEIIDKLMGYSCDLEVIKAVKFTKTKLEEGLNFGKNTCESVIKKLNKLQEKMQKAADKINTIAAILAVFQALVIAFEILVTASLLALNFFTALFAAGGLEKIISDAIDKARGFILKYTEAIKGFTAKCLKIIGQIMIIFNLIPKIISLFSTLLSMISNFLTLIAQLFARYIKGCIPQGELVTDNKDGTETVNIDKLNNFLNSNLGGLGTSQQKDVRGPYIYDGSKPQHRIYKPKLK